jgi:hypothetical protein
VRELESAIDKINEPISALNVSTSAGATFPDTPALENQMRTLVEEFSILVQLRKDKSWLDNLHRCVSPQSRNTSVPTTASHDTFGGHQLNIENSSYADFECLPQAEDSLSSQPSVLTAGVPRTDTLQEIRKTGHSRTSSLPSIIIPGSVGDRIRPGHNQAHQSVITSQATLIDRPLSAWSSRLASPKSPSPQLTDYGGPPPGTLLAKGNISSFPDLDNISDHRTWMGRSIHRSPGGKKVDPFDSLPILMTRMNDIVLSQCEYQLLRSPLHVLRSGKDYTVGSTIYSSAQMMGSLWREEIVFTLLTR